MDHAAYLPDARFGLLGMAHCNAMWESMRARSGMIFGGRAAYVICY